MISFYKVRLSWTLQKRLLKYGLFDHKTCFQLKSDFASESTYNLSRLEHGSTFPREWWQESLNENRLFIKNIAIRLVRNSGSGSGNSEFRRIFPEYCSGPDSGFFAPESGILKTLY